MDLVSTSAKPRSALDENFFQDLLAAAYVVQQHNDALRVSGAPATAVSDFLHPCTTKSESSEPNAEAPPSSCRVCGRPFGADDVFCGNCSMPRVAAASSENLQSKWASLWYLQQAQEAAHSAPSHSSGQSSLQTSSDQNLRGIHIGNTPSSPGAGPANETPTVRLWKTSSPVRDSDLAQNATQNATLETHEQVTLNGEIFQRIPPAKMSENRSPAAEPKTEAVPQRDLPQRTRLLPRLRGRYGSWAVSAIVLLALFVILAVLPSPKNAQLTLFQSLLVKLGLADVPARLEVVKSNPDANVWLDVHTGLYYCEGSDLYGTTPGGHFATQREAQQDAFEPAERVPCP